ncbi:MAG: hypothetical protein KDE27_13495, partial [Planctomycetes bacterium]|nr:hypothetical protein [Planctomycetota bacterium]
AATALPPGQLAAFALGVRAQRLDLTNGCRLFVDPLAIVPTIATANGAVELAVPVPANPLFAGLTIGAQCAGVDAAGGVAASGALELEFGR